MGDLEEDPQFRLINGYGALVDYLVGSLNSAKVELRLNSVIEQMAWRRSSISAQSRINDVTQTLSAGIVSSPSR